MKTTLFTSMGHRLVWRARRPWALNGNINPHQNGNSRSREQGNGCVQCGFLGNPNNQ